MADISTLKSKLQELADRKWDLPVIEARCKELITNGIPLKKLNRDSILANKKEILARVQRRGEEYNFFMGNCARSSALTVMEEFGLGNMDVIKALTPFPGFGGTGWMCGGVTGGLAALGLFSSGNDIFDQSAMRNTMMAARQYMARFEEEAGAVTCPKIQEDIVFGRYMNPGAGPENKKAFEEAKGFEKCSLFPGIGARIATEIIIENLAE